MNGPRCNRPMTLVGQYWVCGAHGQSLTLPIGGASETSLTVSAPEQLDRLPGVLAIPLREFATVSHSVMRLHRLCDAVEILTRFLKVIALGEVSKDGHLQKVVSGW